MQKSYARTEQVMTTIKPAERELLDSLAEQLECSRAELIRKYIGEGMSRDSRRLARRG